MVADPAAPDADGGAAAAEEQFRALGRLLADEVEAALPGWVERVVRDRLAAWRTHTGEDPVLDDDVLAATRAAGETARDEVLPQLRALLELDVDEQRTNPLAVLRGAVAHPTSVLAAAGVPPVQRDAFAERSFPDDLYDLSPASFADVSASLHEPGLLWGAAKAHVVLRRRRAEGRR